MLNLARRAGQVYFIWSKLLGFQQSVNQNKKSEEVTLGSENPCF